MNIYEKRTPTSRALFERAKRVMSGGVSHWIRYFPPHPVYIRSVQGPYIWDVDGNRYIDLWMGHFALILGHRPPMVNEALKRAADLGTHWGIVHQLQIELAELICEMVPCAERLRFCVTGTEATMYAVRLARGFTSRNVIIKMQGGWHGANTDLCVAIHPPYEVPDSAGIPSDLHKHIVTIPFNDAHKAIDTIRRHSADLAGVIVEPVVGAAGLIPATREFLEALREETSRSSAVLIFDEVVTGFRLSPGGAQQHFGIIPDLATLGKIAGGGNCIGVVAGREDIFRCADASIPRAKGEGVLIGGGTFSCSPLSMLTGLAVLNHLKDHAKEIYPQLDRMGIYLRDGMEKIFSHYGLPFKVTGVASLCGVDFSGSEAQHAGSAKFDHEFKIRMLNHGVYVMHGGGAISTAHTKEDLDLVLSAVNETCAEMAKSI